MSALLSSSFHQGCNPHEGAGGPTCRLHRMQSAVSPSLAECTRAWRRRQKVERLWLGTIEPPGNTLARHRGSINGPYAALCQQIGGILGGDPWGKGTRAATGIPKACRLSIFKGLFVSNRIEGTPKSLSMRAAVV